MTDKEFSSVTKISYVFATLLVVVGAIIKIKNNSSGISIAILGFILGWLTITIENISLKKRIKELEKKKTDE